MPTATHVYCIFTNLKDRMFATTLQREGRTNWVKVVERARQKGWVLMRAQPMPDAEALSAQNEKQ